MYFDSHFHLDHFALKKTIPDMMANAKEAGVSHMLAIGGSDDANALAVNTAEAYPEELWCSAGYDREMAQDWDGDLTRLHAVLGHSKVVAVGECGIDYFHNTGTPEEQKKLFGAMIELAVEYKKPVIVHSREADTDTLDMLGELSRQWKDSSRACAVLHCFTGSQDFAHQVLDLGLMISFSGIVSFKNASDLRSVASTVPEDRLLIETDSPYLAPVPHRGKRNEPAWVPHVAEVLADVRGCGQEDIGRLTTKNANTFLGI